MRTFTAKNPARTLGRGPSGPRSGTALLFTLVVVITVSIFALGVMQISAAFTRRQMLASHDMRAFYLAEAALAESYLALTDGSSGQIGSVEEPALLADGLVWVDAVPLEDGLTRLEGTAMTGTGRSTLAITAERIEQSIGIFSSEDVVVSSTILVDGYDSSQGTYEEQATELSGALMRMEIGVFAEDWMGGVDPEEIPVGVVFEVEGEDPLDPTGPSVDLQQYVYRDADYAYFQVVHLLPDGSIASGLSGTELVTVSGGDPADLVAFEEGPGATTARDGQFGSNGSFLFRTRAAHVFGDLVPGPQADVTAPNSVVITGMTAPRPDLVELEPVEVPEFPLEAGVDHGAALPFVIAPSQVGYEYLHVAGGSEVVVRGPATVVLGELTLADGSLLKIENVDAPVNLIVVGAVDLQAGSMVEVESQSPADFALQVATDALVELRAISAFRGTVYAPEAQVSIRKKFELFGAVIARKLVLGSEVRLHFDRAVQGAAGPVQLPILVSWEIREVPAPARARLSDPAAQLGVNRFDLVPVDEALERSSWTAKIYYRNSANDALEFDGPYEKFLYEDVDSFGFFRMFPPDVSFGDTWKVHVRYMPWTGPITEYTGPLAGAPTDEIKFLIERTVTPPQELLDMGQGPITFKR